VVAYVAMLRGINVSGRNKIKMSDLQALFAGIGHTDVVTYIQSGNVVFKSDEKRAAAVTAEIEQRIARELGFDVPVVLRTKADLTKVIAANPFAAGDRARVYVTFLAKKPEAMLVRALGDHAAPPEEFRVVGREVYLHCPSGYGTTKLNNTFWERKLNVASTTRNWNTVTKLLELSGA
jgi:uncharacterized protein (DUF1697 family)